MQVIINSIINPVQFILKRRIVFTVFIVFLLAVVSCGKKSEDVKQDQTQKKEFGWSEDLSGISIPDYAIKGSIDGKEVQIAYVNFEKWRGSNDNVLNFSLVKPEQNCGFIENFEGFTLFKKGGEIKQGNWSKAKFTDGPDTYQAFYKSAGNKSAVDWNCSLEIESISEKTAKGKIVIFFNDNTKSWIAGKFEAVICNN